MGSKAARRHQPGDLLMFIRSALAYRRVTAPADESPWEQVHITANTYGIVVTRPHIDSDEIEVQGDDEVIIPYELPHLGTPCIVNGEQLWVPNLEFRAKRLNRRSP